MEGARIEPPPFVAPENQRESPALDRDLGRAGGVALEMGWTGKAGKKAETRFGAPLFQGSFKEFHFASI